MSPCPVRGGGGSITVTLLSPCNALYRPYMAKECTNKCKVISPLATKLRSFRFFGQD